MAAQERCVRCVMDRSDPAITFDADGQCNHCTFFDEVVSKTWLRGSEGEVALASLIAEMKAWGEGREFDCILGLSGGIDSSFLAVKAYEWGLRPLVVHVDAGWNSELAVHNIERVVKHCGFELVTDVLDWESVKNLQIAYLRSGVANQDVPQDHGFFASLYSFASEHGIKYVLNGGNVASESVTVKSWHHSAMDAINLKAIHKNCGEGSIDRFPTVDFFDYYVRFPYLKKVKVVRPLNLIEYDKEAAQEFLVSEIGYKPYRFKHGESVWTRYFQAHLLPQRFGYDKRLIHLSSLILSAQTTRDEALSALAEPLYEPHALRQDEEYICRKLRLSGEELATLKAAPLGNYSDYESWDRRYRLMKRLQAILSRVSPRFIGPYS